MKQQPKQNTVIFIISFVITAIIIFSVWQYKKANKYKNLYDYQVQINKKGVILHADSLQHAKQLHIQDSLNVVNAGYLKELTRLRNENKVLHSKNNANRKTYDSIYINRPEF